MSLIFRKFQRKGWEERITFSTSPSNHSCPWLFSPWKNVHKELSFLILWQFSWESPPRSKYLRFGSLRSSPRMPTANINLLYWLKEMVVEVGWNEVYLVPSHVMSVLLTVLRPCPVNKMVKIVTIRIEVVPPETVL